MRILLTTLNSKYIHSNLALKYLYMCAKDNRKYIDMKEFTINNDDDYVLTEIMAGGYDLVCFSCYVWNIEKTMMLAKTLKKAVPSIRIGVGGPEVSYDTIEFIKRHRAIDYVLVGEGEESFKELCNEIRRPAPQLDKVKGLVYRVQGKIYVNPQAALVDFKEIPFPYSAISCEEDKILYYESARGCPYSCAYCLSSIEKKVRALPTSRVKKDMNFFLYRNVNQVKFIDRTFNWDKERAYEIIEYIIENDNNITNFHFEICGELVDREFLRLLKEARPGLIQFEIGVQSLNEKALDAVNRNTDISILKENIIALGWLNNIHIHIDLIAGLPYEDYSSFIKSFNESYNLGAHHLQLGFLKLLRGTKLRETAMKYGYVAREKAPYEIISNNFISAEAIMRLKMVDTILNLYYNKGGFEESLKYIIHSWGKEPYDFYEEFSAFYYLRGYRNKSHKKEDLYRILLKYATWKEKGLPGFAESLNDKLISDMKNTLNPDAIKKFEKKGWEIN